MEEKGCGSRNPIRFFINFYNFDGFAVLPLPWKNRERKGWREEGRFVFFVLVCLRPFGLFSIPPANKSFKQFKRYVLLKNLKTNYKQTSQKRG